MPAAFDFDESTKTITIDPCDGTSDPIEISDVDIEQYRKVLSPPFSFVCYKDTTEYDPLSLSPKPGRYSLSGCLYTAESVETAQKEVTAFLDRTLFRVATPDPIFYWDFASLASDRELNSLVTVHLSAGGWELTQRLANHLTTFYGMTALRVPSSKADGCCMNFYADGYLPKGFLEEVKTDSE